MTLEECRDEVKLKLTGGILDCELDDDTIDKVIKSALRELKRYYRAVQLVTTDFSRCIDLSELDCASVEAVFRTEGFIEASGSRSSMDPMYVGQWQLISGTGNMYNLQNYIYDYAAWNTLQQLRNTTSTDLTFRFDSKEKKLYINTMGYNPSRITIEYIKSLTSVEDIFEDYWIDILIRLSVAITKTTLGRVRSRYTLTNAIWAQDGETLLAEGNAELDAIRQHLLDNTQLSYPID